ncbi:MAG: hypothetical protein CL561_13040 [Alphaproteobacteria bacterium]|nr:hypothetical protein [Alphaproteobacteria bacterium]|tara:strand:- start:37593 stop:39398 length:1806 start_codon:yes stop_codon:yes gene_type:complete
MIHTENLKRLKNYTEAGTSEAEIGGALCGEILDFIKGSKDPYINAALKAAIIKLPKKAPTSLFGQVQMFGAVAHAMRGAFAFRALEAAPLTYGLVEDFSELTFARFVAGGLTLGFADDYKRYNIPAKNVKRGQLDGVMTPEHRALYARDCMANASKTKLFAKYDCIGDALSRFRPWNGARASGEIDRLVEETYLSLDCIKSDKKNALKKHCGALNSLRNIALSEEDYALSTAEQDTILELIKSFTADLQRIDAYVSDYSGGDDVASLLRSLHRFQDKVWNADDAESFAGFAQGLARAEIDKQQQIKDIQNYLDADIKYVPELNTSRIYSDLKFDDAQYDAVTKYFTAKLDLLKKPETDGAAINEFEQSKMSKLTSDLLKNFNEIGDDVQRLGGCSAMLDTVGKVADVCDAIYDEVRNAALCALKRSGQYGEASLLAGFTAALDAQRKLLEQVQKTPEAKEDAEDNVVSPLFVAQDSALAQINMILETDMRLNGWDGQWPQSAKDKLPNKAALDKSLAQQFNACALACETPLGYEGAIAYITEDVAYRAEYCAVMKDFLVKAQNFVSDERKVQIETLLADIDTNITAPLSEIGAGYRQALTV